jgi:TRAP-type C4-dicarboxylate transport system permease small subunit
VNNLIKTNVHRAAQALEKSLAFCCALLMLMMVIDVSWQVASRYVLANPSSFSEELARFLLMWISFLGGAYAFRRYAHLGLDLLTQKLEGANLVLVEKFSAVVSMLFAIMVLVYGGSKMVLLTFERADLSFIRRTYTQRVARSMATKA